MDGWRKTYHPTCLYGSDELYLSDEGRSGDLSLSRHVPVAMDAEHVDVNPSRYCQYGGYEDCLSMLNMTLGRRGPGDGWTDDDQGTGRDSSARRLCELGPCSESVFSCIHSEAECLDLIEDTRKGAVKRVRRRLCEKEKSMIRPGSIFVYKEEESGIRRWTDKKEWTPSRVVGTFLAYRNLNGQLYKKTFSKQVSNERYHVVIYSSCEWERDGTCCGVFGKSGGGLLRDRARCPAPHSLSEGHALGAAPGDVLGFDGFRSQAVRPDGLHRGFMPRDHFWSE